MPFWGILSTYEGGGYIANLGGSVASATQLSDQLREATWMDELTRAVLLHLNVYNANSNLFRQVLWLIHNHNPHTSIKITMKYKVW